MVNMIKICGSRRYNPQEDKLIIESSKNKTLLGDIANKLIRTEEAICLRIRKHYQKGFLNRGVMEFYNKQYYIFRYKKDSWNEDNKENNNHRKREKCTLEEKLMEYTNIFGDTPCNNELIKMILRSVITPHLLNKGTYSSILRYKEEIENISKKHRKIIESSNNKYNTDFTYLANIAFQILSHENCNYAAKRVSQFFNLDQDHYNGGI